MIKVDVSRLTGSESKLILALMAHGLLQRGVLKPLAQDLREWTGLSRQSLYRAMSTITVSTQGYIRIAYAAREQAYTIWMECSESKSWPVELQVLVEEHLSPSQLPVVRRLNDNEKILAVFLYASARKKDIQNFQAYLFSLLTQDIEAPTEYMTLATHWFQQSALIDGAVKQGRPLPDCKKLWEERWKRYIQLPDIVGNFVFEKKYKKEKELPDIGQASA